MISKIYTLNAYRSCWKVYPFFQISAILIPFPLYSRTSPVREKRPFLRAFLNEHGVHLSMAVAPPPPPPPPQGSLGITSFSTTWSYLRDHNFTSLYALEAMTSLLSSTRCALLQNHGAPILCALALWRSPMLWLWRMHVYALNAWTSTENFHVCELVWCQTSGEYYVLPFRREKKKSEFIWAERY